MEFHRNRIILKKGEDVNGYKIVSLLGQGGYGEVYKVANSNGQKYAMKTEYFTSPKKALEYETDVIKKLHDPYFPKVYADGKTEDFVYLIIDVLGPSISDIERTKYDEITNEFTLNFAIQSLFVIEKFHENGYVHRDIKPGNFLLKRSQKFPLNLIDFGIAKPYIDFQNGELLDPVPSCYKGTRKYASINSHNGKDLGRCDDLFSWFYCVLEMKIGKLPWRDIRIFELVKKMKENQVQSLIKPYPELSKIYDYLVQLNFKDRPNYSYLKSIILDEMNKNGYGYDSFDWIGLYDRMKKHLKSCNCCPNNQISDDNDLENKKEIIDNRNTKEIIDNGCKKEIINDNQINECQNQNEPNEITQNKHHKKNKKVKKIKRNHKNCLIS